ncbi:ImpA family metalloprotease [Vibrio pelagius]|uniref:ImpA family metalloprotease n=1 Tax=Vibrio pelagius TaxID=28169 RepID=UPI0021C489F8|nr:ImpA family metalloprotease [Vibrio pelagius]
MKKSTLFLYMAVPSLLLTACGGGSDSNDSTQPKTAVQRALESGDASLVSDANEFIAASESFVSELNRQHNQIKNHLMQGEGGETLNQLFWDPTHDAAIISSTYGFNDPILKTNKAMNEDYTDQELVIGVAGYTASQTRYAALASNPFRTLQRYPSSVNEQMETWLKNLVNWAAGSDKPAKIVLAQMDQSYYFPDDGATRNWIKNNINSHALINDDDACDAGKLKACLEEKPDLLIISQQLNDGDRVNDVVEGLNYSFEHQIPVLYLHLDGGMTELGRALFTEMHIQYEGDNYWRKLGLSDWDPKQLLDQIPDFILAEQALLHRLKNDSFNVDLKLCDDKSCADESLMDAEFYRAANTLRMHLNGLDKQKVDLFANSDYEYEKLILLLADSYRQDVSYPMDKNNTERIDFLRSYFSDYVQYQSRSVNAAQPNLGNFSTKTFEDVPLIYKTVTLESKRNFRSAGVYALPGQTIKVTRVDRNDVSTSIAFNSLRSGATHEFSKDGGYARPKFLTSVAYPIEPGETIILTSAYGGTLQVHFDKNDINVELKFENVAQHPVWRSEKDNERFVAELEEAKFDWAELITPGFEVHSKLDKMQTSIGSSDWNQPHDMALATERYMHNFPHALAGFRGPGIDEIAEVHGYGDSKGWQVETIDIVKHMNADQATCGYGCSGNPYDAYWAFHPLGHGDLHELGHGLEKGRFRFSGWEGHSTTNYYSYYSKSRYYQDTGNVSSCQSLDFKGQYELLQQSRTQPDPNAFMAQQSQTHWSWGARVFIQMMMLAQEQGVLDYGWHMLGRLHLIEREFNRLKSSDDLWNTNKQTIGFNSYSREEANQITNDDWLLIALSYVNERDMRNYLDMWGFNFTDKAKSQVAALSLTPMPLTYFASSSRGYCVDEFAKAPISVDGVTAWPLN